MKRLWPDISPEEEEKRIEAYRRMTPAEKIPSMGRINTEARRLATETLQLRYPNADAAEIRLRVVALYLPDRCPCDLMQKSFNWTNDGRDADLDYEAFGHEAEAKERTRLLASAFVKQ